MVDVDRELALAQLKALVAVPGALKVITAEHVCGIPAVRGQFMPTDPKHIAICDGYAARVEEDMEVGKDDDGEPIIERVKVDKPITVNDPRHFVLHDVVELEEALNGRLRAKTAEGDWTEGQPAALLKRLQEWRT